jgi:uncharacterized protein (TIGR00106 family)
MAVVFLTITPIGTATPSVSRYVAGVEKVLRESGLVSQLTAMGTIIEGDLDEILKVVRRMHEHPFGQGAVRVSTLIKIDDRRDQEHTIAGKMRSVEEKLSKGQGRPEGQAPRGRARRRRSRAGGARRLQGVARKGTA